MAVESTRETAAFSVHHAPYDSLEIAPNRGVPDVLAMLMLVNCCVGRRLFHRLRPASGAPDMLGPMASLDVFRLFAHFAVDYFMHAAALMSIFGCLCAIGLASPLSLPRTALSAWAVGRVGHPALVPLASRRHSPKREA